MTSTEGSGGAPPLTIRVLGSYYYLRRVVLADAFAGLGARVDFFADSGAFSAFSSGATVDVDAYADWLLANSRHINCAATLDVIGDPHATAVNTRRLIKRTDGKVQIMPAFHVGSPWSELKRLCDEHPYVALGGAVALTHRMDAMTRWLVRAHGIARDADTRLHGFGLTKPPFPHLLPWYSVDSSYWLSASRTGSLALWDDRQFVKMRVGTTKARAHAALIRRYGGDPVRVTSPGFGIVRESGPIGSTESRWMAQASLLSWYRYEAFIRGLRGPVPPPRSGSTTGDGIKVYLAIGSARDLPTIVRSITVPPTQWRTPLAAPPTNHTHPPLREATHP